MTWLGLGVLRVVCWLPHTVLLRLGNLIGNLAFRLAGRRRAIVKRNLRLCFPDMSEERRDSLAKAHFRALGMSLIEMGLGRWASDARLCLLYTSDAADE